MIAVVSTLLTALAASAMAAAPNCTSALTFFGNNPDSRTQGPVRTIWTTTVTSTSQLDCSGCGFLATTVVHPGINRGPVVVYTSTTMVAAPSTVTERVCLPSAE